MKDMVWIYAAVVLLLSEAWGNYAGTNQSTTVNSSTHYEFRKEVFKLGSEANLTCNNKTWNEMMFVVWTIKMKYREGECQIGFDNDSGNRDTCKDGKSLRNTTTNRSYLHIPNFSEDDVGIYKCQSVFSSAEENFAINVTITVPPSISAWWGYNGSKVVAVCKAERGKPAANISWSHMGNIVTEETSSHGYITVESRLELLEGVDRENVSCSIRHPFWEEEKVLKPTFEKGSFPWLAIIIVVIIVFLAGFVYIAQKKLLTLRRCQQSKPSPSKPPPSEDKEEVEPYSSYVQRVNSIYNSSADLFT